MQRDRLNDRAIKKQRRHMHARGVFAKVMQCRLLTRERHQAPRIMSRQDRKDERNGGAMFGRHHWHFCY